jgi:hypothetical protein
VTDLEYVDHPTRIIDVVDDPVAALAHAVPLLFADQLLATPRSRTVAEGLDATHDPLAFSLASISLIAEVLIGTLYRATPLQPPQHLLERNTPLSRSLLEGGQILGVFSQTLFDGLVDQFRHRPVALRSLQTKGSVDLAIEVDRGSLGFSHDPTT